MDNIIMKKFFLIIFIISITINVMLFSRSAITYKPNGGRLGDKIISYYRAKQLSLRYDIPLFSHHMGYGNNLVVDTVEEHYSKTIEQKFHKIVRLSNVKDPILNPDANILYVIDWSVHVSADWNDKNFLSIMRSMIAPTYEVPYIQKPDNALTIAIHVRTGGGYVTDTPHEKRRHPLKFPPFNFYITELNRVISLYPDQKLYVHIFTDHQQPEKIVNHFKSQVKCDDIMYGYRTEDNCHDANVLDDFFNMMQFDVIIFPRSGLSIFAHKLGFQILGIMPVEHNFINRDTWEITKVCLCERNENDIVKKKIINTAER
jgi:hypothetical protein